jgi:hypothetical protein
VPAEGQPTIRRRHLRSRSPTPSQGTYRMKLHDFPRYSLTFAHLGGQPALNAYHRLWPSD